MQIEVRLERLIVDVFLTERRQHERRRTAAQGDDLRGHVPHTHTTG